MPSAERSEPMGPVDYIILAVIALILGASAWFIWRSKKKGVKCIGCPSGKDCGRQVSHGCSSTCASCSGCHHQE